ncbi:hypothetical protein CsatB_020097 [Cannabis sativa]
MLEKSLEFAAGAGKVAGVAVGAGKVIGVAAGARKFVGIGIVAEKIAEKILRNRFLGDFSVDNANSDNYYDASSYFEAHEKHLQMVLQHLWEHEIYAKFEKCKFWLPQVSFLGHVVNKDSILVDPVKIEAVRD